MRSRLSAPFDLRQLFFYDVQKTVNFHDEFPQLCSVLFLGCQFSQLAQYADHRIREKQAAKRSPD